MLMNRFLFSLIGISLLIPAVFGVKSAGAPTNLTRGELADAERWTAMSMNYLRLHSAAPVSPNLVRIWETDANRWTAMGQAYGVQSGWTAEAARWTAIAYANSNQRGWNADAARWTAMGEYYTQLKAMGLNK